MRNETINNLIGTLKQLERELRYRWLKDYVQSLKQKEYLNGKESFILRAVTANLKRIEADRRSISLGLTNFFPYDERQKEYKEIHTSYLSWDRSVSLFDKG